MLINYPVNKASTVREFLESFYLSKSKIYTLFFENKILVNDHKCKERDLIKVGDIITIDHDEEIDYKIKKGKLDILYEDQYFLIINKPYGIIIHNGKDNDDALCNLVAGYYKENGISLNIRFAHRIDKDTTGIIVFCKDILTLSYMNHFIETHEIRRAYRLLVSGYFKNKKGVIDKPIGEDRHSNSRMRISNTGKESITEYEILKQFNNISYVECKLKTGRKHQIRVHMASLNHPLLGDTLYGGDNKLIKRVALHSYNIKFIHPFFNEEMDITAKLPIDMNNILK